jgi:outer membrane protein assembly factor BamB
MKHILSPFLLLAALLARGGATELGLPRLPTAISSFGAATLGDTVWTYGGHVGVEHEHTRTNQIGRLWGAGPGDAAWRTGPESLPVQGTALVAGRGRLYRLGGLQARNDAGEKEDLHSTSSVESWAPGESAWRTETALPEARSSHDAVVVGDWLHVAGGWTLAGASSNGVWLSTAWKADLRNVPLRWEPTADLPAPRRAMALAALSDGFLLVGGLGEGKPRSEAWRFRASNNTWHPVPAFPGGDRLRGFGSSAVGVHGGAVASGWDGRLWFFQEASDTWHDSGLRWSTPRFFHRLVALPGGRVAALAGASEQRHCPDAEVLSVPSVAAGPAQWTSLRADGQGVARSDRLPLQWSSEQNVRWSAALPGYGQSAPVIWGDAVYLTLAVGDSRKETLRVLCLNLVDGRERWCHDLVPSRIQEVSPYFSRAAPSPVVDADGVVAWFETGDVIALNHAGQRRWHRDTLDGGRAYEGNHGWGASLAQSKELVFLLQEMKPAGRFLALAKSDGAVRWEHERDGRVSWSSPVAVAEEAGRTRLFISSTGVVEEWDTAGKRLWREEGLEGNTVACPAVRGEVVYVAGGQPGHSRALRRGEAPGPEGRTQWTASGVTGNFASPLLHRDRVYFVNKAGVASAVDARDGRVLWTERLAEDNWAAPLAWRDRLYFTSKTGVTQVVDANAEAFTVLARNTLPVVNTRLYAMVAGRDCLLLREGSRLWCVAEESTP